MKRYILYSHDGSGNHGCEALVRSTIQLLGADKKHVTLVSTRPEEDIRYGIDRLCNVVKLHEKGKVPKLSKDFVRGYYRLKNKGDYAYLDRAAERATANARPGDVAISIGGDCYCYGGTEELAKQNHLWREGELKTVLWGCSIEPELLSNPNISEDIKAFDLITARESISYDALKKINKNTVLTCDSAFFLEKTDVTLSEKFDREGIVGINVSPLILRREAEQGQILKNITQLMDYILQKTTMNIMLIPHVIWNHDNDLDVLSKLYEKYKDTGRILLVGDCNAQRLKGYISKCRFLITARTHASIAGYSLGIPTLVLGYSVKSRGIAYDLFGTDKNYVLPVQNMNSQECLIDAFLWLQSNEEKIKQQLREVLPEYTKRINVALNAVSRM